MDSLDSERSALTMAFNNTTEDAMFLTTARRLEAADYKALAPGEFFIYITATNDQAIAVTLKFDSEEYLRVLTLTGKDAFVVRDCERDYNAHVLPLRLEPTRLRLQADIAETKICTPPSQNGRLVVGAYRQPGIEVTYESPNGRRDTGLVSSKDWTYGKVSEPRFGFRQWALVYQDDFGQVSRIASNP